MEKKEVDQKPSAEKKIKDVELNINKFGKDGICQIAFNQPLVVPDFMSKEKDGRRQLQTKLGMSQIDVNRDLF